MGIAWNNLLTAALAFTPRIIAAMVILIVGVWAGAWSGNIVKRLLERRKVEQAITALFAQITRWGVIGLALTMALQQVGFDLTAFLTGIGILGFTVGFALQDISKNLTAGILLLLQRPFDVNEAIQVGDYAGTVEEINLRATALRTFDGRLVYLPNADVYTSAIVNFSRSSSRRVELTVGVAYGTDLAKAKTLALEAIQTVPGLQSDVEPLAVFHTFNDSSMDMTLYFWVNTAAADPRKAKDAAVQAVYTAFNREGIDIPFPIRTVLLENANTPAP